MSELSIVIRTFNCRDPLRACLDGLDRQTLQDVERVVVDSGSTDGTPGFAASRGIRVLSVPAAGFTYGGALNFGFAACRGRYLCALSAHCLLLEPTVLERMLTALRTAGDRAAGVSGTAFFTDEEASLLPPGPEVQDRITLRDFQSACNRGLSNSFSIVRRDLWEAFPFPSERCEDQKWAAHYLAQDYFTLGLRTARYRYRLDRPWRYYVRKHCDDLLMLYRTWPEAEWPKTALTDGMKVRYRFWHICARLRLAGWRWDRLSDAQKWFSTLELGLFEASARVRGGRLWPVLAAADVARTLATPARRKGWVLSSEKWP